MVFEPALLWRSETTAHCPLTYRQPQPLAEEEPQQVALSVGSQQVACSAGEQHEEGVFACEAPSGGCLGERFSLIWEMLSVLIAV